MVPIACSGDCQSSGRHVAELGGSEDLLQELDLREDECEDGAWSGCFGAEGRTGGLLTRWQCSVS